MTITYCADTCLCGHVGYRHNFGATGCLFCSCARFTPMFSGIGVTCPDGRQPPHPIDKIATVALSLGAMNPDTGAERMSDHEEREPLEVNLEPVYPAIHDLQRLVHDLANRVQANEPRRAYESALALVAQANIVADELEAYRG